MPLLATEGGSAYPVIPEDVYQAVCYAVIDCGTQYSEKFEKSSHQAIIIWEIPSERIEIEREGVTRDLPRVISKKYTLSLGDRANLRKDLESWRGKAFTEDEKKGFDIQKLNWKKAGRCFRGFLITGMPARGYERTGRREDTMKVDEGGVG